MKPRARGNGVWLIAVLMLAAALRLVRLGTNSFWHDEVHNLIKAEHIWDLLARGEYISNHPPLFPILLAAWTSIGLGANEWTVRLLPALLGVGVVLAVYAAGRTLFDGRVALFAAFLAAISPFFIAQSQDLKEYIVLPITGTLAVCALYNATTTNAIRWWAAYSVAAALACYSESFAGPLLIAANFWFMLDLKGRLNRLPAWFVANAAAFLAFVPYLLILLRRARVMLTGHENWWIPEPTLLSILYYVKTLSFGYSSWEVPYKVALVTYVAVASCGLAVALVTRGRSAMLVMIWFVVPVGIVFAISHVVESIFLYRALIPFAVPFYLLVAVACARLPARVMPAMCATVFAAIAAPSLWQHYNRILDETDFPHRPGTHPPQDYRGATDYILANWREGDAVVTAAANAWLPMYWYGLRDRPLYNGAVDAAFIQHIEQGNPSTTSSDDFTYYFPKQVETLTKGHARIWYVFSEWERKYLPGNAMDVWRWMDAHCLETGSTSFLGIDIRLYDGPGSDLRASRRDDDDGISAAVSTPDGLAPYRVVVPDSGLIAAPYPNRRGALRVTFSDADSESEHVVAQTDAVRKVSVSVANDSAESVNALMDMRASDALVTAASLWRTDSENSVWRVGAQYNPDRTPLMYERSVAVAHFRANGNAALSGTVSIPDGVYDSYIYALGSPGDVEHSRAEFGVEVGRTDLLRRMVRNRPDRFHWNWITGAAVFANGTSLPVRVTADRLLGADESFADVGYVALVRQRGEPLARVEGSPSESWPGDVTIGAQQKRTWTIIVDDDMPRIDVWVYEDGADGRAYHIFDDRSVVTP